MSVTTRLMDSDFSPFSNFNVRRTSSDTDSVTDDTIASRDSDTDFHNLPIGWGEEGLQLAPSASSKNKCSIKRVLTNVLSPISLIAASVLLSFEMRKPNPDPRIITACYFDIGACCRAIMQANLPKPIMNQIHDSLARWSLELYEILWNWYLNETNAQTQSVLLNVITALGGYHIVGDALTAINLKKGDRPERTLAEIDLDAPTVNKIIGPDYNDRKWQLFLKAMTGAVGVGLTVFGYIGAKDLQPLCISIGYFLTFHGVGFFGMEKILQALERAERNSQTVIDIDAIQGLNVDLKKRIFRTIIKLAPRLAVEGFAVLSLASRLVPSFTLPILCATGGVVAGAAENQSLREFQVITDVGYQARMRENFVVNAEGNVVRSTALKVDLVATAAFFALFIGWFIYGYIFSPPKEQIEISVLMGAALITLIFGLLEDRFFKPEECGRGPNTFRYLLHHNPFLLAIIYFGLTQITAIDDESLQLDSKQKYVCGLIALALFGINLSANRIHYTSVTRSTPAFTPPLYRIELIKTLFLRFMGRLDN